jgi:hypothetical protein
MGTAVMGAVTAQFAADSRNFDSQIAKIQKDLKATGEAATQAAAKVKLGGDVADKVAAAQARAMERARAAWDRELAAQDKRLAKEQQLARAKELAALRQDIETRAIKAAALAQEELNAQREMGEKIKGGLEMAGFGGLLAIPAAIEGLKEMFKGTMETGVEIGHMNQQTGISVETLSKLKFVASENGIEFEALAKGFKKLSTEAYEAGNGGQAALKSFAGLGITEADLAAKGNDLYAVLAMVSDKFKDMPDGIQKNALATQLFGKAGQTLIPVMNDLAASMEEAKSKAAVYTEVDIQKMERMHKATKDLAAEWEKLKEVAVSTFGPALSGYLGFVMQQQDESNQKWHEMLSTIQQIHSELSGASRIDLSTHFVPGVPSSLMDLPTKPVKPAGGGGSGSDDAMTINLANLFNQQVEDQTKNVDANRAQSAKIAADMAAGAAAWQAFLAQLQSAQGASALAAFGGSRAPNVSLAPQKAASFFAEVTQGLDDWINKVTDVRKEIGSLAKSVFADVNNELVKLMTGKYHRGDAGKMLQGVAGNFAKTGLQMTEGSLLKAFGMDKKLGSRGNPSHVVVDNMGAGMGGPPSGTLGNPLGASGDSPWGAGGSDAAAALKGAGGIIGSMGGVVSGILGAFSGGGVPSAPMSMFSGMMADGGLMNTGGFYLTSERGPELVQVGSTSRINNSRDTARMMGGGGGRDGAFYDFSGANFGGASAAEMKQYLNSALTRIHGSAVQSSAMLERERKRRTPGRGM